MPTKKSKTITAHKAPVYNIKAEKVSDLSLSKDVFSVKVSPSLIAKSIRVYLNNQHRSHPSSKNRAEVSGTTKKMWAQKGTGQARHGSAKAPIFVGGGVAHGPRGVQNYRLKLNKKTRAKTIKAILSLHAQNNSILIIDKIDQIAPKTKQGVNLLQKLKKSNKILNDSKKIGIITTKTLPNTKRAFKNIPSIKLINSNSLNVFNLSNQNFLIFSLKAIQKLK